MTTMETPRDKVVAHLKAATTLQSADEIATATKLGEGRVANILNALRTDKQIDSRKVGDGKKKTVMKYWFTGEGLTPPCADRPAMKTVKPAIQPRALTNELLALMQKHPPKTEFRAEALTAMLNAENPGQPLTSQVVSQRLKSMTGRHTGTTKHIIADGDQKRPGGRDYYLTYYLLNHPAENAAAGLEDGAREADEVVIPPPPEYDPASVAFQPSEPTSEMGIPLSCGGPLCSPGDHHPLCRLYFSDVGDSEGGETDAPAPMIVAMTSSGGPTDPLDDIRHVLSLPDDLPADKVAEAIRLRVAGLTRSVQDLQNQLAAISIALQQSGIDLENQSPVESIQALNGAIKLLKDELDRESQPVLVPIKNVTDESLADKALHDLRATIAGTGATLTIREQSDMVGVIYHRNRLAVARPGRELIEVVEAIRTLNQHTPRQEAA
ncbi:MAG: hypothetical protein LLG01_14120 [Planctomycetaceae bacterium]|nr:hypothetical protein [Planctomycetaceae bacterium]